jgi:hypothetical protein
MRGKVNDSSCVPAEQLTRWLPERIQGNGRDTLRLSYKIVLACARDGWLASPAEKRPVVKRKDGLLFLCTLLY